MTTDPDTFAPGQPACPSSSQSRSNLMEGSEAQLTPSPQFKSNWSQFEPLRLWIDGVGGYLFCPSPTVAIGGPTGHVTQRSDIALVSNLSRQHARFVRSGEFWLLEAQQPTFLDGRPILRHTVLSDRQQIRLGSSVIVTFRLPSMLSGTACLEFVSAHSTEPAVDGVILFAETCVLGSGNDAHLRLSGSPRKSVEQVLLIRRTTGLWCKSNQPIQVDGRAAGSDVPCEVNRVYSGADWQFRLEPATV